MGRGPHELNKTVQTCVPRKVSALYPSGPSKALAMAAMEELEDVNSDQEPPMLPGDDRNLLLVDVPSWKSLRPGRVGWNRAQVESRQIILASG